ncbi:MAG: HAD family hydrolase [Xanthomonadales bacterium]|nr:HAD family hydrolase [Xanthomonadales bacterium]
MSILAISLDLDDTLWPVAPAISAAEEALDAWLRRHHAEVARRWPLQALRELREDIAARHPHLAHDFTAQRRLTLAQAFGACGFGDEHVEEAYEVYFAARNRVECYADAIPALVALAARLPVVSISNGNADLERIGLRGHFAHCISAREEGVAKPHPAIFLGACARLGIDPAHVLHVGDDPLLDVAGAQRAGLRAAWLNRSDAAPVEGVEPDLVVRDLGELLHWLDGHAEGTDARAVPVPAG